MIGVHPNWSKAFGRNLGYALQDVDSQAYIRVTFEDEGAAQTINFTTKDTPEAISAWLEKRPPVFRPTV